jgi:hypothetical protein
MFIAKNTGQGYTLDNTSRTVVTGFKTPQSKQEQDSNLVLDLRGFLLSILKLKVMRKWKYQINE